MKSGITINLIQELRFIHSLNEIGINVVISKSEEIKWRKLKKLFSIDILFDNELLERNDFEQISYKELVTIDHTEPRIVINELSKSLIFPLEYIMLLKSGWYKKRNYHFSFVGLMTEKREEILQPFIEWKNINIKSKIQNSKKGRVFPDKSFDKKYYRLMQNSKFVLCPNGDFIWSYRFVEAIFCGAIPIVEDDCEMYQGFKYFHFTDDVIKLFWTPSIAIQNLRLAIDRFSFSHSEIIKLKKSLHDKILV